MEERAPARVAKEDVIAAPAALALLVDATPPKNRQSEWINKKERSPLSKKLFHQLLISYTLP